MRGSTGRATAQAQYQRPATPGLLAAALLGGWLGVHRYMRGQIGMGILYTFTMGLFCIGWIVDIATIAHSLSKNSDKAVENYYEKSDTAAPKVYLDIIESEPDDYLSQLREDVRANIKENSRPTLGRADARPLFYSYQGSYFDFSNVPTAESGDGTAQYLLDGTNAYKIIEDLLKLDKFADQAEQIVGITDFRVPVNDILFLPEWVENKFDARWYVSHFSPLPFTKTGNPPKYPFRVFIFTRFGEYEARIKYTQKDEIGEAEISIGNFESRNIMVIRNEKIVRILNRKFNETFPLYSETTRNN